MEEIFEQIFYWPSTNTLAVHIVISFILCLSPCFLQDPGGVASESWKIDQELIYRANHQRAEKVS